ncbi:MAG: cation diffusion facilitator family transporter [Dehalococcoidia bacterium]|nr:cation diffusion facilitator family transporter [Dehalococcoidia bacterium]
MRGLIPADLASRAAVLSLAANVVLMVVKITAGLITDSVAVLSDGIDSATDVIASGIVYASVRIGAMPADPRHPYGHGRIETLAASAQALLIASGGVFILFSSVRRLLDPPADIGTSLGLTVMLVAALVNLGVAQYARSVAKMTGSPAIAADARHLVTNIVQAGAVFAGLGLVALTDEVIFDALLAFALGLYLLWTAANILWSAAGDVMDAGLTPDEVEQIEAAIRIEGDAIAGFHDLRTRRSGQSRHIDFHLDLPPSMTMAEAHLITDRIEARLRATWPASVVTIHTEPDDSNASAHGYGSSRTMP